MGVALVQGPLGGFPDIDGSVKIRLSQGEVDGVLILGGQSGHFADAGGWVCLGALGEQQRSFHVKNASL